MIYHIVTPEQWEQWSDKEHYEAPGFQQEGFIHLCTEEQIAGVLERYYSDVPDILLLHVDTDELTAPLKWEAATNDELFPHLYGPLNKSAIAGMESFSRASS